MKTLGTFQMKGFKKQKQCRMQNSEKENLQDTICCQKLQVVWQQEKYVGVHWFDKFGMFELW